jgi:hypothetical protein
MSCRGDISNMKSFIKSPLCDADVVTRNGIDTCNDLSEPIVCSENNRGGFPNAGKQPTCGDIAL